MNRGEEWRLNSRLEALYSRPVSSHRAGDLFNTHPYPTRIAPAAIVPFLMAHTGPGDVIVDGFAGTGSTGLAALLCEEESASGQAQPTDNHGPRNVHLFDVSELAGMIGRCLSQPPSPSDFDTAARTVVQRLRDELGWMYRAVSPTDGPGEVRHAVWTDVIECAQCHINSSYWELAASWQPVRLNATGRCPSCGHVIDLGKAPRAMISEFDPLLGTFHLRKDRRLSVIYGRDKVGATWRREALGSDLEVLDRVSEHQIPQVVPIVRVDEVGGGWGSLHRPGYHAGISHLHHFYTRRNLIVIARAWEMASETEAGPLREALRMWVSSYNASHSTLMTRVAAKSGARDFTVTSAQSGTLYVPSAPVEKNVISGLDRRVANLVAVFRRLSSRRGQHQFHVASSTATGLANSSVDYVFTDPPFGGNIPYSEIAFISEAWLGKFTSRQEEAIVNAAQAKGVKEYQALMTAAFSEAARILKPDHYMTLVFHSSDAATWEAIRQSWSDAGFEVCAVSTLDKVQPSLKQTVAGTVRGDCLILLRKPGEVSEPSRVSTAAATSQKAAYLYSQYVADRLESGQRIALSAHELADMRD